MDISRLTSQGLLPLMDWVKSAMGARLEIWLLWNHAYITNLDFKKGLNLSINFQVEHIPVLNTNFYSSTVIESETNQR